MFAFYAVTVCWLAASFRHPWRGAAVVLALFALAASDVQAITFTFDNPPLPTNAYAFAPQNATGSAVRTTQAPIVSSPYALKFSGVDNAPAYPSYAYVKLFDVDIPVTSTTVLSYQLYPVTASATSVAVDLQFDTGPDLRDRGLFDDAGVRIHPAYQPARLQVGQYNSVRVVLSSLQGLRIKKILIGYDRPPGTGAYDARLDEVKIEDSNYVLIEGDKVDAADQPFTDPLAIVDPFGVGSSCGSSLATQSASSRACHGGIPHYVAQARIYKGGYARMLTRIPQGRDVVVSVCNGSSATSVSFACREHPPESFCRPKQSSSSARVEVMIPPTAPAFVDVRWKYIPEASSSSYSACDRKAPYAARVLSDELNVDPRLGDADASGAITVSDGVTALRCAAGVVGARCDLLRADLDCQGGITVTDGLNILRLAAGLRAPAGCDRDGDGLVDEWEEFGYDHNGDGLVDVPLHDPPFNASAFRKDIFVECDYMAFAGPGGHTHRPLGEAIGKAVEMFARAPLANLNGVSGITLHVDTGQLGGAMSIPHEEYLEPDACARLPQLEATYRTFPSTIFHYCVFVHHGTGDEGGQKCDNERNEFYVSLGELTSDGRKAQDQAGAFVHELGHDLGLNHGGSDGGLYKPNYLSGMNYAFAYGLIFGGAETRLDYSRFDMVDLNERALNEAVGLDAVGGDAQLAGYGTRWFDPQGVQRSTANAAGNIDWNFNGNGSEMNVSVNIDNDPFLIPLDAWNDWQRLKYKFGNIGSVVSPVVDFSELEEPIGIACDLPRP